MERNPVRRMLPHLFSGLSDLVLGRRAFLSVEILGETQGHGRAFFHRALHCFLVTTQSFALYGFADLASLNIQQDLYLLRLKRVAVHDATDEFLHQAVKPVEPCFAVYGLHEHIFSFSTLSATASANLNKYLPGLTMGTGDPKDSKQCLIPTLTRKSLTNLASY